MQRKILAICIALATLSAFAIVPAMAPASPVLTENGEAVATSKHIVGIGETVRPATFASSGGTTVTCNDYWLTGEVHVNNGTEITETITNATFHNDTKDVTEDCSSNNLGPIRVTIPGLVGQGGVEHWCLKSLTKDRFEVRGGSCTQATGTLTFALDITSTITGPVTCKYERFAASVTGSFNTNTLPATATIEGEFEFTGETSNSFLCPATMRLTQLAVQLYTDTTDVFSNFSESLSTEDPLVIS